MSRYTDRDAVLKLAQDVAKHLDNYEVEMYDFNGNATPGYEAVTLVHGAFCLMISQDFNQIRQGKIKITGILPQGDGPYDVDVKSPSIAVSLNRDGKAVARDIARRLLPDYIEAAAKAREQIDAVRKHRANVASLGEMLAAKLPGGTVRNRDNRGDSQTVRWRGYGGSIEIHSGGSAEVTIRTGDTAFLSELAELIAKHSA